MITRGSRQGMGSFIGTAGDEGPAPISLGVTWMGDSDGGNASGGLELSEGAIVSIARAEVRRGAQAALRSTSSLEITPWRAITETETDSHV